MARAPCPSLRRQGSRHVPPDPCRGPPPGIRGFFDFKSLRCCELSSLQQLPLSE